MLSCWFPSVLTNKRHSNCQRASTSPSNRAATASPFHKGEKCEGLSVLSGQREALGDTPVNQRGAAFHFLSKVLWYDLMQGLNAPHVTIRFPKQTTTKTGFSVLWNILTKLPAFHVHGFFSSQSNKKGALSYSLRADFFECRLIIHWLQILYGTCREVFFWLNCSTTEYSGMVFHLQGKVAENSIV